MSQVTCPNCGSVYERDEVKVIFRDHDSYECEVCGKTLESWNGSRIPTFRLLKHEEKPAE